MRESVLPAYVSNVPSEPIDLSSSIIINDDEVSYLIGQAAMAQKPDATRRFGGTPQRPDWLRLLKALVANTLGEGEHEIDSLALSAAFPYIEEFRRAPGSLDLNSSNEEKITQALSRIVFKTGRSDKPWKECSVKIKSTKVFSEVQAVQLAVPNELRTFVIWQLGHGDWQQGVWVDGKPMRQAADRAEGLAGAIRNLAEMLNLNPAEADKAWRTGFTPDTRQMGSKLISCEKEKRIALKNHVNDVIGKLINRCNLYRAKFIVLSGGGAKDDLVCSVLREEVEAKDFDSSGNGYKFFRISDLPLKHERCDDPSMTCVRGLLTQADLALDVGNSYLKSAYLGAL